jgi:glutaminase
MKKDAASDSGSDDPTGADSRIRRSGAMASRSAIDERPYVSTGHLPNPEMVQSLVEDAHRRLKSNADGKNSQVYPALARVPSELFGVCVVATNGQVYGAGT